MTLNELLNASGLTVNSLSEKTELTLKDPWNCTSRIILVWSLFCSIRVYRSLHFLPILLDSFWNLVFLLFFLRFFALYRIGFNVIFTNFITFALHNNQCLQKYQVLCVFSLISKKRSCHKHLSIAFNKRTASQRELFEFLILKVFIYKGKCDIH